MGSNDRAGLLRDSEMAHRHSECIMCQCIHRSLKSYHNTAVEYLCAQVYRLRYHVPKDWELAVLLNVRVENGTCTQLPWRFGLVWRLDMSLEPYTCLAHSLPLRHIHCSTGSFFVPQQTLLQTEATSWPSEPQRRGQLCSQPGMGCACY